MNFSQFKTASLPIVPQGMRFTPINPFVESASTDVGRLLAADAIHPLIKGCPDRDQDHAVREIFGNAIREMQRLVLKQFCGKGRKVEIGAGPFNGLSTQLNLRRGVLEETDASPLMVNTAQLNGYPVNYLDATRIDQTEGYGPDSLDSVIGVLALDSMDMEQRSDALASIYKALKPGGHLIHFLDDTANTDVFENFCLAQGYHVFNSKYDRLTRILVPTSQITRMVQSAEPPIRQLLIKALNKILLGNDQEYFTNTNRLAAFLTQQPGVLRGSPNDVFFLSVWWALQAHGFTLKHFGFLEASWNGPANLHLSSLRKNKHDPMPNCFVSIAGDTYADFHPDVPPHQMKRICKMHVLVAQKPA